MRKAIILMLHHQPEQANLFIDQLLTDPDITIYVHIDKKAIEKVRPYLIKNDRVKISDESISISWGANGLLKATLLMYRMILKDKTDYEYVIMCTGQDLMVKPYSRLDQFLEEHKGELFIDCRNDDPEYYDKIKRAYLLHKWPTIFLNRYDNKHNIIRMLRSARIRLFLAFPSISRKNIRYDTERIHFYYDKVWHAFPMDVVRWIIDFLDKNEGFWDIYENSFMADEGFFTTVIMNSDYKDKLKFDNGYSRSITFNKKAVNNHPPILVMEDINEIDNDQQAFFARKFDINVDNDVIKHYVKVVKENANLSK